MLVDSVASRKQLNFQVRLENFQTRWCHTWWYRLFHTFAATTGKARPPMVSRRTRGIMSSIVDAVRSRWRLAVSATRRNSQARYGGAKPLRHLKTSNAQERTSNVIHVEAASRDQICAPKDVEVSSPAVYGSVSEKFVWKNMAFKKHRRDGNRSPR